MNARRLALWFTALTAAVLLAAMHAPEAAAQDEGDDTTEIEAPAGDGAGAETDTQDDDDALVALGVLAFGILALAGTLLYLDGWRRSSTELIKETLAATGQLPDYEFVASAVSEDDERRRDVTPAPVLSIRGPALVRVGRGARFRALLDDAAVEAEWSVLPAEAGRAEPATGDSTTVTALRLGPLTVRATAAGATAEAHAVAVAAPRRAGRIPLVAVGYGGITIAIVALTLAAAATAYGKLDGAALVALAGAVVGYFFVEARGQQTTPDGGGTGATSGAATGPDAASDETG